MPVVVQAVRGRCGNLCEKPVILVVTSVKVELIYFEVI